MAAMRAAAVGFSLLVHISAALWISDMVLQGRVHVPKVKTIRLELKKTAAPEAPPKPKIKPAPPPKRLQKPLPKKMAEIKKVIPKKEPLPEPVVENIPPPPVARPVSEEPIEEPKADMELIEKEKQRQKMEYFAAVMGLVKKNRFYPAAAKRRGIEADVKVRFTLLENGSVENLSVVAEQGLIERAAREAVMKSLPFPPPPGVVQAPTTVEYVMEFRLRN